MDQGIGLNRDRVFARLIDESRAKWHCLRTFSRQDRVLARELEAQGLHAYALTAKQDVWYGDTLARVDVPVFPDLVFLYTTTAIAQAAAEDSRVRETVNLPGQTTAVPSGGELTVVLARELLGVRSRRPPTSINPLTFDVPSSGAWSGRV